MHIYAHTNDIIDIYLLYYYYIYRKQECNYRKAEKGKKRKGKERDGKMERWKDGRME